MSAECVQVKQTKNVIRNKLARGEVKPQALHGLLTLVVDFKHLLNLSEQSKLGEETWAQVLEKISKLRAKLRVATFLTEEVLGGMEPSSLKTVAYIAEVIKAWPAHPKRKSVLELLEYYGINVDIFNFLDESLSGHNGNFVGLLNLDLRAELAVLLEVQVEQLMPRLRTLEQASTEQEKQAVLRALRSARLEEGISSIVSVNDFELTLSAVATLALLRPRQGSLDAGVDISRR